MVSKERADLDRASQLSFPEKTLLFLNFFTPGGHGTSGKKILIQIAFQDFPRVFCGGWQPEGAVTFDRWLSPSFQRSPPPLPSSSTSLPPLLKVSALMSSSPSWVSNLELALVLFRQGKLRRGVGELRQGARSRTPLAASFPLSSLPADCLFPLFLRSLKLKESKLRSSRLGLTCSLDSRSSSGSWAGPGSVLGHSFGRLGFALRRRTRVQGIEQRGETYSKPRCRLGGMLVEDLSVVEMESSFTRSPVEGSFVEKLN